MTPEELRRDYDTVSSALRALSNAWVREEVPTIEDGLVLVCDAQIALARLAAIAHVPHEVPA